MLDLTEPDVYAPPRQVYGWTVVPGHDARVELRQTDRVLVGSCGCGARGCGVSRRWREEHLANAWPVLVQQEPGERRVVARAFVADLDQADNRPSAAVGARMAVKPGEPYPVIEEADIADSQLVEVLEHQLAQAPFARPGALA
jgi:hypothetical protein